MDKPLSVSECSAAGPADAGAVSAPAAGCITSTGRADSVAFSCFPQAVKATSNAIPSTARILPAPFPISPLRGSRLYWTGR